MPQSQSQNNSPPISKELLRKVKLLELRTRLQVRDVFSGRYHSVFKGQGMDFAEVREYTPGDDVRSIDWNVSARMGHPFVKLYREERELTVMLLVDISASNEFGTAKVLKREVSAELTALFALCALNNNDKVGLLLFTDTVEHFVAPKKGRRHVLRLIRDVLAFQPSRKGTSISAAVEYVLHALRKRSVLFLISDFNDNSYEKAASIASRKHDLVAIELHDPREREIPPVGLTAMRNPETDEVVHIDTSSKAFRKAFREHAIEGQRRRETFFKQISVDRIDLPVDRPYILELIRFFRTREKRK